MKQRLAVLVAAVFAVTACADTPTNPTSPDIAANFSEAASDVIPGRFIVTLRSGTAPAALAREHGISPDYIYTRALTGFAGRIPDAVRTALLRDSRVVAIEQDQIMRAIGTQNMNAQNNPWGLDRIDQRDLPLSGTYTYNTTGSGVNAYIIDTGLRPTHNEFGGRASIGYDAVGDGQNGNDCNGHGTHVGGTVGGSTYGVAKGVKLIGVRVLDCDGSGTNSGVIAGVDWVTSNHVKPAVANMSLGGGASDALDNAVRNSIAAGVTYAIAAGNGDFLGRPESSCNKSPARVAEAITVGATDSTDKEASWSNYGTCNDIYGPGVAIISAWYQSDTQLDTISGTSMATPHVAGAAALYLETNTGATPATVRDQLVNNSTSNTITQHSSSSSNGTPNRMLYMAFIGSGSPPPPSGDNPPTASFTYSCSGFTCNFDGNGSSDDNGISAYDWNYGDGTTGTGVTSSHTFAKRKNYTVTLKVTDTAGQTGSTSKTISCNSRRCS